MQSYAMYNSAVDNRKMFIPYEDAKMVLHMYIYKSARLVQFICLEMQEICKYTDILRRWQMNNSLFLCKITTW